MNSESFILYVLQIIEGNGGTVKEINITPATLPPTVTPV